MKKMRKKKIKKRKKKRKEKEKEKEVEKKNWIIKKIIIIIIYLMEKKSWIIKKKFVDFMQKVGVKMEIIVIIIIFQILVDIILL